MKSFELIKQIYERAPNKDKAFLTKNQESFFFKLQTEEGNFNAYAGGKKHNVCIIDKNGEWRIDLTKGEAIEMGEENIKYVELHYPPFYIKRNGFNLLRIVIK